MAQRPTARGLFLCEQVIREEGTRNITLVNCFTRKRVRRDPPEPIRFVVHAFLVNGLGDMRLAVVALRLDNGDEVLRRERAVSFRNRLQEAQLTFRVPGFAFPARGHYEIVLLADEEPIAQCRLVLVR